MAKRKQPKKSGMPMPANPPSPAQWKALFDAARQFGDLRCWESSDDEHLFGVQNPETGEIGFCCIMGMAREYFGMALYLGAEGLATYYLTASGAPVEEVINVHRALLVTFGARKDLNPVDLSLIKDLKISTPERNMWPSFRSIRPGYLPWFLNGPEARFMTHALTQAIGMSQRIKEDPDLLDTSDPDGFLVRVSEDGNQWRDEWQTIEPAAPFVIEIPSLDPKLFDPLRTGPLKHGGTWELWIGPLPEPMADPSEDRPFYPQLLLCVDAVSGMVLDCHLMGPKIDYTDATRRIVQLAVKHKGLPATVRVDDCAVHEYMLEVARHLDFKVRQVDELPNLGMAFDSLLIHLRTGNDEDFDDRD